MNTLFTWNTKKTETGFMFTVSKLTPRKTPDENGHYVDTEIVKVGTRPTRARSKGMAQKWCIFYKREGQA